SMIIATGHTGDAGRAALLLKRCIGDARNSVLLLSFQEEGSVGHALLTGSDTVTIGSEQVSRNAAIHELPGYSGHADGEEMRAWVRALGGPIRRAFVVNGDDLSVAMMVTILREEGVRDVIVPREGESFPF
ncbi:MAG: MBL fold metallo-hydrolase RNA specificity domain-containing protein, partial [Gemmatimonadales bacterium]